MKRACLLLTLGAFLTNPAFAQTADSTTAPAPAPAPDTAPAPATPPPKPPPAARPGALTKEESQELRKAQADALKANPALVAERKDLDEKNKALLQKIDNAAVKADPNVAAIIAKRDAGKKPMASATPKDKPKPTPTPKPDKKPKPTDKKPKAPTPTPTPTPSADAPANKGPE